MSHSKSIDFFATKSDLEPVAKTAQCERALVYTRAGMFPSPCPEQLPSALMIPNLGVLDKGQYIVQPRYLVTDADVEIRVEPFPNRVGGPAYAIDQKLNPQSVTFGPGGIFEGQALIPGSFGTCTDDAQSRELLNLFARELRRRFQKVRTYYVGTEAAELLDRGFRLTADTRTPRLYDLAR